VLRRTKVTWIEAYKLIIQNSAEHIQTLKPDVNDLPDPNYIWCHDLDDAVEDLAPKNASK
jgi:hypothetical protein